jgi:hypothetical protein
MVSTYLEDEFMPCFRVLSLHSPAGIEERVQNVRIIRISARYLRTRMVVMKGGRKNFESGYEVCPVYEDVDQLRKLVNILYAFTHVICACLEMR